jgi:cytochrome c oxidase cbb3-type subunit III
VKKFIQSARALKRIALALLLVLCPVTTALAQTPAANDATPGQRAGIRTGLALYRLGCANCHGLDAQGAQAPDLVAIMAAGVSDQQLFQTIRNGRPGTEMPPSRAADGDIRQIVAYLRSLEPPASPPASTAGDPQKGERIFAANCAACHVVDGHGGRLGPALSRIGGARSKAALMRKIRTPSEIMTPGYEPVTLVLKDGRRVRGARKNDDLFSIQIMDQGERIQGYVKADLQQVIYEKQSLMPPFGPERISSEDMDDLISYLNTLRAAASSTIH